MQEKDFETPAGARAPMDVAEFYDSLETKRMARLDGLVQQYNSIESLLIKVREYSFRASRVCCLPTVKPAWGADRLIAPRFSREDGGVARVERHSFNTLWVFNLPLVGESRVYHAPRGVLDC